jgi:hypothetical protein
VIDDLIVAAAIGAVSAAAAYLSYEHWDVVGPYFRKYGWYLLIPLIVIGVVIMYVARRVNPAAPVAHVDAVADAQHVIDTARANAAQADAELAQKRLEAQASSNEDVAKLNQYNVELRKAQQIEDASERRAQLIKLVEGAR